MYNSLALSLSGLSIATAHVYFIHHTRATYPLFDLLTLKFAILRISRDKMQCIQDTSQSNVDILNNVRREASRHFRNKKKAYLSAKIEELETNSKIQNIRDLYRSLNDCTKGYQPRCNIMKDEKGDLTHSIMARWRNYFSQLFNVHGAKDVG